MYFVFKKPPPPNTPEVIKDNSYYTNKQASKQINKQSNKVAG